MRSPSLLFKSSTLVRDEAITLKPRQMRVQSSFVRRHLLTRFVLRLQCTCTCLERTHAWNAPYTMARLVIDSFALQAQDQERINGALLVSLIEMQRCAFVIQLHILR